MISVLTSSYVATQHIVDGYIPSLHVDLMDIALKEFEGKGEKPVGRMEGGRG